MAGMFRLKDEAALKDLLKGSHLKVRGDTSKVRVLGGEIGGVQVPVVVEHVPQEPAYGSDLEALFGQQLTLTKLPKPTRQYLFLRGSKHTLDFAWPDLMIGVEVQGMVHRIKGSFKNDIKKRAQGLLQGWKVLEVGGVEIKDGTAMEWLHQLFEMVRGGTQ